MNYWLVKSEPDCFSIDDLNNAPNQITTWDGVRNYQARNFMKQMKLDDLLLFYHSNCKTPGIVGLAKVVKTAYPDDTAWDPQNEHFDPKSLPTHPRWFMVDVQFQQKLKNILKLHDLYQYSELQNLALIKKGNRLSVMPVSHAEWSFINKLITKLG